MRHIVLAAFVFASVGTALAQQPPANPNASNPAINTPNSPPNPGAPAAGANSFTEGQAKSRIENNGYTNVSGLAKDNSGVWRGKASKDGKTVDVSVDFQGNVVAR
jgi:hypothetical protein